MQGVQFVSDLAHMLLSVACLRNCIVACLLPWQTAVPAGTPGKTRPGTGGEPLLADLLMLAVEAQLTAR